MYKPILFWLVLFFVVAGLAPVQPAPAQSAQVVSSEAGRPFFTCFSTREHGGAFQTWTFEQDDRGVIYAGNNLGVLEYDGAAWRLIETGSVVRGLDRDANGRIYVGSFTDLGYLTPDASGQLQFHSLLEFVPEEARTFTDIWTVYATDRGIYFQTRERLFRLTPGDGAWQVKTWEPTGLFYFAFWMDGTYYVHQGGSGLMKMVDDELEPIPGGDLFANDRMQVMLRYDDERMLIGAFSLGLYLYDGQTFTPFSTEADPILRTTTLYKGIAFDNGTFGLITTDHGMIIINRTGQVVMQMDQSTGMPSSTMYAGFVDRDGQAWIAPNNGICQIETTSPLSRFDESLGVSGAVNGINRHNDLLYLSTESGVFFLQPGAGRFQEVTGITGNSQTFDLLEVDNQLLAAVNAGIFKIDGATATSVRQNRADGFEANVLHRSLQNPNRVFAGLGDGLASIRQNASGQWIDEGRINGLYEYITHIKEPEPGLLWIGTAEQGALRVRFNGSPANPTIERFGAAHGLPENEGISIYETGSGLLYATERGIFRFDASNERFVPDTLYSNAVSFGGSQEEYSIAEDMSGYVWINFGRETAVLRKQADGSYQVDKTALLRFADTPSSDIYPEDNGVIWFGSADGLIRYDSNIEKNYAADFPVLVRRVTTDEDSVIYGGAGAGNNPTLTFADNALRFEYAALSYENPLENRYQSMLEGFDDHWSAWTRENKRDYTNLPPGDYTFHVRAQNTYNTQSAEATYAFTILPPWYRTIWAYLLYALALGGLIFGFVHTRTRRLEAHNRMLEQTVQERTHALQQRLEELGVINSVQEGLVAELDMQAIYDLVGNQIRDIFDAQAVIILTFDHEIEQAVLRFMIEKGERFQDAPTPFNDLHRHLIQTRETVLINKNAVEEAQRFGLQVIPSSEMSKSLLFVPMVVGDSVRGMVSLQNIDRENAFSDSDVRLLTTLTNSMSVALENARLFDESVERANEMATVNRISRALVAQLEFDALIKLVGDQIRETFQADIVYVALLDKETDTINFPYGFGDDFSPMPFGDGLTSQIIKSGEPLLINENMSGRHESLGIAEVGKSSASYLGVPISVGQEMIGVISVQSTSTEGRFDEDDRRLLTTIAANVSVALQNAEAYRKLNETVEALNKTLADLKTTQQQLVTQEKMASLGALTAGIAHEIKNPLNFVNNFAELNAELAEELREELNLNGDKKISEVLSELGDILSSLKINALQIAKHGQRADAIVKNMMNHASTGTGERFEIGVNAFVEEYINLAYHGRQGKGLSIQIERDFDERIGTVAMVPQDMGRVLVNLLNNAFDALTEHTRTADASFVPTVTVRTRLLDRAVSIQVQDNGPGIPDKVRDKIFEPFFTTKPTGSGTGLGLSMSYDIVVQSHGGTLEVESTEGEGTTFIITLPA